MKKIGAVALSAALFGVAASALAQEPHRPVGLSMKVGIFIPTDDNTRRGNNSWFAAGVEYQLHERFLADAQRDKFSVSLDYASRGNYRTVPLLVNMTRHHGPVYFTGGLGVSFSRYPTATGIDDRARFAYQVGIGYEFSTSQFPLFVEGRFLGNQRPELNGFGIYVGARF